MSPSPLSDPQPPDWVLMDVHSLGKLFYNNGDAPLSETIRSLKAKTLTQALDTNHLEILPEYLRSTDGLVSNDLRRKIWPLLLRVKTATSSLLTPCFPLDNLNSPDWEPHRDEDQVRLDINRSFTLVSHWHAGQQQLGLDSYTAILSSTEIDSLRKRLFGLVVCLLRKYPSLHYYQGFHDVAGIVLLVCGNESLAFSVLEKLTVFHLRDFMVADISLSVNHLRLIPAVLELADEDLFRLVSHTNSSYVSSDGTYYNYTFYPALSLVLTLFSHDISHLPHLLVIWDFILGCDSVLASAYVYVAFLLHRKNDIFDQLNLDQGFEYVDHDLVHSLLSPASLFADVTDATIAKVLSLAKSLMDTPVETSPHYHEWFGDFNHHSVLNNTSSSDISSPSKDQYNCLVSVGELSTTPSYPEPQFPRSLSQLMEIQEQEISEQAAHLLEVETKVFEQQESLATSVNSLDDHTGYSLLASSLLSLSSASSSINTKVASTSKILKRLFSRGKDDEPKPWLNPVYRYSLTVGFVGFLVHYLLRNSFDMKLEHVRYGEVFKSIHAAVGMGNIRETIFHGFERWV